MRNIASFKSDLTRKLHGTSLSKVEGVYDVAGESARNVLTHLDPQETVLFETVENALFDELFFYTAPANLKGDKVVDFLPQGERSSSQNYSKRLLSSFNRNKEDTNHIFNVTYIKKCVK